jgi:hypothetical protein
MDPFIRDSDSDITGAFRDEDILIGSEHDPAWYFYGCCRPISFKERSNFQCAVFYPVGTFYHYLYSYLFNGSYPSIQESLQRYGFKSYPVLTE